MIYRLQPVAEQFPPPSMSHNSDPIADHGDPNGSTAPSQPAPAFSPLYQQIKGLILRSFQSGEWKPGEAIPSEMELSARFRVSQGTVRKAIDELASENLVVRRQGKGTFVATHTEQHVQYRFLRLMPDAGDLDDEGPAQRNILECRKARATADVARALGLRAGEAVMQVRRVLAFKGVPTILEDLWLPALAFKGLSADQIARNESAGMPRAVRFKVPDGTSENERFRELVHGDGRLHAGGNAVFFQRVGQSQTVDHCGQHAHVVGRSPVHAVGTGLDAAENVSATHHDGHFHAQLMHRKHFIGHEFQHVGTDAEALISHQGLAADLQQHPLESAKKRAE